MRSKDGAAQARSSVMMRGCAFGSRNYDDATHIRAIKYPKMKNARGMTKHDQVPCRDPLPKPSRLYTSMADSNSHLDSSFTASETV